MSYYKVSYWSKATHCIHFCTKEELVFFESKFMLKIEEVSEEYYNTIKYPGKKVINKFLRKR